MTTLITTKCFGAGKKWNSKLKAKAGISSARQILSTWATMALNCMEKPPMQILTCKHKLYS